MTACRCTTHGSVQTPGKRVESSSNLMYQAPLTVLLTNTATSGCRKGQIYKGLEVRSSHNLVVLSESETAVSAPLSSAPIVIVSRKRKLGDSKETYVDARSSAFNKVQGSQTISNSHSNEGKAITILVVIYLETRVLG
ncbi:hypothetical protein PILCRDRAFT_579471 [Piloderma croceum F 1598]|uniref:Uncharacterized protein n=1 Tax=Piloderma croceum (strain F 1598) TaxID=765440 RepID=A0A0C3AY12_PILCF|nr:hypothetical protein PILCRDRAFT_579471 [Piloderma croceum F 1598]